jgi:hypothetical protein
MHFLQAPSFSLRQTLTRSALVQWVNGNDCMMLYGPIGGGYRMTYWIRQRSYPYPIMPLEKCEATLRTMGISMHGGWTLPKRTGRAGR